MRETCGSLVGPVLLTELSKANHGKVGDVLKSVDDRSADIFEMIIILGKDPKDVATIFDMSEEEVDERLCATTKIVVDQLGWSK